MIRERAVLDEKALLRHVNDAAFQAQSHVADIIRLGDLCRLDANRLVRLEKQECQRCFYLGHGQHGNTPSTGPYIACGTKVMSSTTELNQLCNPCAILCNLCVLCGGDISMRYRRRKL